MAEELERVKSALAKLEKASGADRNTDVAVHIALGLDLADVVHRGAEVNGYTSSLDATIALVERVLPGSVIDLCVFTGADGHSRASICRSDADWPYEGGASETGLTPPLALLTAMFRALVAKMEKADG